MKVWATDVPARCSANTCGPFSFELQGTLGKSSQLLWIRSTASGTLRNRPNFHYFISSQSYYEMSFFHPGLGNITAVRFFPVYPALSMATLGFKFPIPSLKEDFVASSITIVDRTAAVSWDIIVPFSNVLKNGNSFNMTVTPSLPLTLQLNFFGYCYIFPSGTEFFDTNWKITIIGTKGIFSTVVSSATLFKDCIIFTNLSTFFAGTLTMETFAFDKAYRKQYLFPTNGITELGDLLSFRMEIMGDPNIPTPSSQYFRLWNLNFGSLEIMVSSSSGSTFVYESASNRYGSNYQYSKIVTQDIKALFQFNLRKVRPLQQLTWDQNTPKDADLTWTYVLAN